jgi:hypothetical protein
MRLIYRIRLLWSLVADMDHFVEFTNTAILIIFEGRKTAFNGF